MWEEKGKTKHEHCTYRVYSARADFSANLYAVVPSVECDGDAAEAMQSRDVNVVFPGRAIGRETSSRILPWPKSLLFKLICTLSST